MSVANNIAAIQNAISTALENENKHFHSETKRLVDLAVPAQLPTIARAEKMGWYINQVTDNGDVIMLMFGKKSKMIITTDGKYTRR